LLCTAGLLLIFFRVTSACFSEDATLLAVGFQDSGIRVWSLTKQKLRSMKTGEELNEVDKEAGKYPQCLHVPVAWANICGMWEVFVACDEYPWPVASW